jgi:hypothetical protein
LRDQTTGIFLEDQRACLTSTGFRAAGNTVADATWGAVVVNVSTFVLLVEAVGVWHAPAPFFESEWKAKEEADHATVNKTVFPIGDFLKARPAAREAQAHPALPGDVSR